MNLTQGCCRAWTRTKNTHIQSVVCYQLHHAANVQSLRVAVPWIKDWSFGPLRLPPPIRISASLGGIRVEDYVCAGLD